MKVYPSYLMIMVPSVLFSSSIYAAVPQRLSFIGTNSPATRNYRTKPSFVRKRRLLFPSTDNFSSDSTSWSTRLFLQLQNSTTASTSSVSTSSYQDPEATLFQRLHNNKLDINLLLLDNYDSYTYNLYSYLSTICVHPPTVISNDAYESWEDLIKNTCVARGRFYDGIIISPGPGRPDRHEDIGICLETISKNPNIPILGVCLGHQALGHRYHVPVDLAPCGPVHGLLSKVWYNEYLNQDPIEATESVHDGHDHCDLFHGIPQLFRVVRYHSLTVNFPQATLDSLDIEPIAWCIGDSRNDETSESEYSRGHSYKSLSTNPDAVCMALRHKKYPHYGVQFHPESIGTGKEGYRLLENFCEFCSTWKTKNKTMEISSYTNESLDALLYKKSLEMVHPTTQIKATTEETIQRKNKYKVLIRKMPSSQFTDSTAPSPQSVFEEFYEAMDASFWLDSSSGRRDADKQFHMNGVPSAPRIDDSCPITTNSRFSILGGMEGSLSQRIEYYGKEHDKDKQGLYVWGKDSKGKLNQLTKYDENLLTFLQREMKDLNVLESVEWDEDQDLELDRKASGDILSRSPPFKFRGGWVGYLGYEFRHDTRLSICDQEICKVPLDNYSGARFEGDSVHVHHTTNPNVPTAAFIFADRSLVYDHWRDDWYVVAVTLNDDANASRESEMSSREWIRNTCKHLQSLKGHQSNAQIHGSAQLLVHQFNDIYKNQSNFQLLRSKHQYEVDIARCLQEIKNGESYELCLTNKLNTKVVSNVGDTKTPFGLYKILRRINPAPYSAYLNFGCNPSTAEESNSAYGSLAICCSSPELFLSVSKLADDTTSSKPRSFFTVESKPIKGTAPRKFVDSNAEPDIQSLLESEQLRRSIKNRAENLMIVDLLRNDFSRVCEPGSVHVPKLMQIESYATVHQMVSTIRGIIDSNKVNAMDVISACFPGGSMTGAPKLRSVDILDDIEEGVSRGPYSGCLGYMSLDGCMDMNIVIRTAILTPYVNTTSGNNDGWDVSIGAGGAITALSESDSEYDEMLLKARALLAAVNIWDNKS